MEDERFEIEVNEEEENYSDKDRSSKSCRRRDSWLKAKSRLNNIKNICPWLKDVEIGKFRNNSETKKIISRDSKYYKLDMESIRDKRQIDRMESDIAENG